MTGLRKLYRLLWLIVWMVFGIFLTLVFLRNTRPTHGTVNNIISYWLGKLTRIFGVKIKTVGVALPQKTLFIANHLSWLDTIILGHLLPVHFLSKYEVKTMPVFGWIATRAGTLYIKRGKKNSASDACIEITHALQKQHNALVFAEGTTSDGNVKKFHARMMQSAIDADAIVQPVAIFYPTTNSQSKQINLNPTILFIDDTTMGESFNLIMRSKKIDVEVHYLEPISSTGKTRDEIAQHTYDEVVEAIKKIK